jgi:Dimerisation domain/O-methyltransferase domain
MSTQQASLELMRLINGYQISQVIHVAASLGIADLLKDGPRPSEEIAEATGAHAPSMYRLLHALASAGVVEEQSDSRFSLTVIGECLRSDSPHSRVEWARMIGRPYIWQSWGELRHSVTTGEPAFVHLHGVSPWEWRAERPEEARLAGAAQSEVSRGFFEAIVDAFDFSRFRCIVDVGGGAGAASGRHPGPAPRKQGNPV